MPIMEVIDKTDPMTTGERTYKESIFADIHYKSLDINTKNFDDDLYEFDIVMTTGSVDNDGETIVPAGADFSFYDKQPAVLYNHGAFSSDVQVVGRTVKRTATKSQHIARVRMAVKEWDGTGHANKPLLLYRLYKAGTLKSASIGFNVLERNPNDRLIITKWRLKELSLVIIPANDEAMTKAFKSGVIDTKQATDIASDYKTLKKVLTQKVANESMRTMTKKTATKNTDGLSNKSLVEQVVKLSSENAVLIANEAKAKKRIKSLKAKLVTAKADNKTQESTEDKGLSAEDKAELAQISKSAYNSKFTKAVNKAKGKVD